MIAITYNDAGLVHALTSLRETARNPRQMMMAVGREVANQLKDHFQIRDANQPNKLGGEREHFWNQVRGSVQNPEVDPTGLVASVAINDPRFAQKVFGGDITPKRAAALTIPQTPEAYGRTARTFVQETGLTLFLVKHDGHAFLATAAENHGIIVEYILTPLVHQDPDPDALPRHELLEAAAVFRAQTVVDRQNREAGLT